MERFKERAPVLHPETFVAEGARLIGRVVLAAGASVWYNSVLRADIADIIVGENTNIQDNCVVHVDSGRNTVLGRGVTVGHGAILHACTVGDNCLVGMGAILLDGCVIPRDSIVGAGSLVPPGKTYPEGIAHPGLPRQGRPKAHGRRDREDRARARSITGSSGKPTSRRASATWTR